jgi:DNA polymerase
MVRIQLERPDDTAGVLRALGQLVRANASPDDVLWHVGASTGQKDLFGASMGDEAPSHLACHEPGPAVAYGACDTRGAGHAASTQPWPADFEALADSAALHDDPQRLPLLHRLAARVHADRRAWQDTLDPDRIALERMARQVRREIHKMHAFVRFKPVRDEDAEQHVAWFEPAHHIVRAAAPFFARRFASMRWSIFTPRGCVAWDRQSLRFAPGAARAAAPALALDDGDELWLTYYRSIFNPARVKVAAMRREMPVRYWKNLPEASAISTLLAEAPQRAATMVAEAEHRMAPSAQAVLASRPARAQAPNNTANVHANAQAMLTTCQTLAARCTHCAHAAHATQTVWGEGPLGARLMLVGEQPGDREDLEGRPFVGPAGQLLRAALDELHWPHEQLYLTNAVKHFKYEWRGKRRIHKTPAQREALACLEWLEAEIQTVRPQAIVALGATAARSLLGPDLAVAEHEGRWLRRADGLPVLVVRHPAAILRSDPAAQAALRQRWVAHLRLASPVLQRSLAMEEA